MRAGVRESGVHVRPMGSDVKASGAEGREGDEVTMWMVRGAGSTGNNGEEGAGGKTVDDHIECGAKDARLAKKLRKAAIKPVKCKPKRVGTKRKAEVGGSVRSGDQQSN